MLASYIHDEITLPAWLIYWRWNFNCGHPPLLPPANLQNSKNDAHIDVTIFGGINFYLPLRYLYIFYTFIWKKVSWHHNLALPYFGAPKSNYSLLPFLRCSTAIGFILYQTNDNFSLLCTTIKISYHSGFFYRNIHFAIQRLFWWKPVRILTTFHITEKKQIAPLKKLMAADFAKMCATFIAWREKFVLEDSEGSSTCLHSSINSQNIQWIRSKTPLFIFPGFLLSYLVSRICLR